MSHREIGLAALAGGLGGLFGIWGVLHPALWVAGVCGGMYAMLFTVPAYLALFIVADVTLGLWRSERVRLGYRSAGLSLAVGWLTGAAQGMWVVGRGSVDGWVWLPSVGVPMLLAAPLWAWRRNYDKTHPPEDEASDDE